jgi:tRNA pseudouridine38-40 synthase
MVLRNIKLTITYDGSAFHGWQTQANARTVQETMEAALEKMTGEDINLTASGRTDAGVHALGQVANFKTGKNIPLRGFERGLNSLLPPEIAVISAREVSPDFHSRTWAREKEYLYRIVLFNGKLPLLNQRAWIVRNRLRLDAMAGCAAFLKGRHDFTSFMASGSSVKTTTRTITGLEIEKTRNREYEPMDLDEIRIRIRADGFLRYMVRNIVGFMVEAGLGKREPSEVKEVLSSRDRSQAGPCAPARGLYLYRVFY